MGVLTSNSTKKDMPSNVYVTDVPYTWNYFEYQCPVLLSQVASLNGFAAPDPKQPFNYCDLGCGNGVTGNLLASVFPQSQFYGIDLNEIHALNGNAYAKMGGLNNSHFYAESFLDFDPGKYPKFHYIVLHGVYSWVPEHVRKSILNIAQQALAPNGLLYVSYNALPGWSQIAPIWKLMQIYMRDFQGSSIDKVQYGLENLKELRKNQAGFFKDTPYANEYLDEMIQRDKSYLAHEFVNGCFEPFYFDDVAKSFSDIGLSYAGRAKFHRNFQSAIVSEKHHAHLNAATDNTDRENRVSVIRNEMFRRDIYSRNEMKRKADKGSLFAIKDFYLGSVVADHKLKTKLRIGRHNISLEHGIYPRLIDLAKDGKFKIGDIINHATLQDHDVRDIEVAVYQLLCGYQFQLFLKQGLDDSYDSRTIFEVPNQMNGIFLNKRLKDDGKTYVASNVTGTALKLSKLNGLFALCLDHRNLSSAEEAVFEKLRQMERVDRKRYTSSSSQKLRERVSKARVSFERDWLPVLLRLGVIKKREG